MAIEANSEWAREVIEELEVKDKKKDETFFCHQARMCALKGDAEGALRSATECSAKEGVIVRLRTYTPALATYARLGVHPAVQSLHTAHLQQAHLRGKSSLGSDVRKHVGRCCR